VQPQRQSNILATEESDYSKHFSKPAGSGSESATLIQQMKKREITVELDEELPRELDRELVNFYKRVPESSSSLADSPHKNLVPETITINSINFDKKVRAFDDKQPPLDQKQYSSVQNPKNHSKFSVTPSNMKIPNDKFAISNQLISQNYKKGKKFEKSHQEIPNFNQSNFSIKAKKATKKQSFHSIYVENQARDPNHKKNFSYDGGWAHGSFISQAEQKHKQQL